MGARGTDGIRIDTLPLKIFHQSFSVFDKTQVRGGRTFEKRVPDENAVILVVVCDKNRGSSAAK
jgi:hypothetical protein